LTEDVNAGSDRLGSRDLAANRRTRAAENREVHDTAELRDEDRLDLFRQQLFNDALHDLPEIPGWHVCWLTTTNPRDPIQRRTRLGYEPVRPEDVPGFEFAADQTGEFAGMIRVNEMVAFKIPQNLYEAFMQEVHHDAPLREEEKLAEVAEQMRRKAEAEGSVLFEGDGMVDMRDEKPRKGVFAA
jgi:hypothetical protein